MEKSRRLVEPKDILIIVLLIALLGGLYIIMRVGMGQSGQASVTVDGTLIARIPLDKSGRYEYPELPGVVFTVADGSVRISENDCADLTCVRTGTISRSGQAIICLPKKIAVEIERDAPEKDDVDVVLR